MSESANRATFTVGHWTDLERKTGCTTILFDRLVPAIVDVRGGSPGTRETDLLGPDRTVGAVDAIYLTGGSAHGIGAADGVMGFLRDLGRGVPTRAGNVPIVSAAVIYDLDVGEPVWPLPADALASCLAARPVAESPVGAIGAGTGATFRKAWRDLQPLPGGLGIAQIEVEGLGIVHALAVVNALGDAGRGEKADHRFELLKNPAELEERSATTLVTVILDGDVDARTLRRACISAHDGMARVIRPCHTAWDGDLVYVASTSNSVTIDSRDSFRWCMGAELAVESAILTAVGR